MTGPGRLRRHPLRGLVAIAACVAIGAGVARAREGQGTEGVETFDAAWRIIRDSHFDKTMNGVDWDAVGAELRPRALAARTAGDLRAVVREMLARLGQSHFALIPSSSDNPADVPRDLGGTPGFDVRLAGRELLVVDVDATGGAASAGIRRGWKVLTIDGMSIETMLGSRVGSLSPRLLPVEAWRLAQNRLRGPAGSRTVVGFEDGTGRAVQIAVERRPEGGQPVTVGTLPTMFVRVAAHGAETPGRRAAGVIRFNVWMAAVDPLFQQAVDTFRTADGMVVDLRGNPGGLAGMLMGISGHFIDERKPLGVMKTRENPELRFMVNPRRVNARGERVEPYAGPVAILVDALTGSASECFTGGMQAVGRVRVFGEQSMGQALPALFSKLPNGDVLIHAYGDFVTADGTRLEGRGVIPDEAVALSRADLLAGRDRPMEAALAWIDQASAVKTARTR